MYDTLKKRILMSQVETAASDNVAQVLKSMGSRPGTHNDTGFLQTSNRINEPVVEQPHRDRRQDSGSIGEMMLPPEIIPSRTRMRMVIFKVSEFPYADLLQKT